jgi:hypothetical protein
MKFIWLALSLLPLGVMAADDLSKLKVDANNSIEREERALKSSKRCIDSSQSVNDFKNCNYNPANFNSEIQEEQEQPDTGTHSEATQTHGF